MQANERSTCLPTSVAKNMLTRMRTTHERSRIAIFTGPPGIGKTTAIGALRAEFPDSIGVVSIPTKNASAALVLRHMLRALQALNGDRFAHAQTETSRLAYQIQEQLRDWRHLKAGTPRLTLIFDEAQTLSRAAIEALRFYNDAADYDAPFPIGLIFVGNHELSLAVDDKGNSTISAAVASRAFYKIEFDQGALCDADYHLILEGAGIADRAARDLIVRYCARPRMPRDLRQLKQLIEEFEDEAGGAPITVETVQAVLTLV